MISTSIKIPENLSGYVASTENFSEYKIEDCRDDIDIDDSKHIFRSRKGNVRLVNCTPHVITLIDYNSVYFEGGRSYSKDPCIIANIEPCGVVSRCKQKGEDVLDLRKNNYFISLVELKFGAIKNLPSPKDGVLYIVSYLVAIAGRRMGRNDLIVPTGMVHDQSGKIIGCTQFAVE